MNIKRRTFLTVAASSLAAPALACDRTDRSRSANVTPEILAAIKALNIGVVDCGAGDGYWLRAMREVGIDCIGYDPAPRGEPVLFGTHLDVARRHSDRALLIVWPPDGHSAQAWLDLYRGPWILFCVSWPRLIGVKVPGRLVQTLETGGREACSTFEIYEQGA